MKPNTQEENKDRIIVPENEIKVLFADTCSNCHYKFVVLKPFENNTKKWGIVGNNKFCPNCGHELI